MIHSDRATFVRQCVAAASTVDKMHLRVERIEGATYRVLSLRPGTAVRFATNRYHETWHILSRPAGAALLSRMLWALSFQEREGTLLVIHGQHLASTPFDAEASDPIVLVPSSLTQVSAAALGEIRRRLARGRSPDTTVKLRSFSLDEALADDGRADGAPGQAEMRQRAESLGDEMQVRRVGGCVCVLGTALRLRLTALAVAQLARPLDAEQSADDYLGTWRGGGVEGEVQIFGDFDRLVREATLARREVLASGLAPEAPDQRRLAVQGKRGQITAQRRRAILALRRAAARGERRAQG